MKKISLIFVVCVFVIFALPLKTLDTWMPMGTRLDTGDAAGANASSRPQIACSGDNVYVVWDDARNGETDIYFNWSSDNGVSWQPSDIRLNTGDTAGANESRDQRIACLDDHVYVVWWDRRNGAYDIYFNYSNDYGAHWSWVDFRLDTGDTAGAHDSTGPEIAVSGSSIYVVWHDARNGYEDIYFNYSPYYGIDWQHSAIRLDTGDTAGTSESWYPQIACTGNNVYVVWYDNRNGYYDIYFNHSTDNGASWLLSDIRLDTGDIAGVHASLEPKIACSENNVYAVWYDMRNGSPDIFINYSTDSGASWQPSDIRLDTGDIAGAHSSYYPQIACSGSSVYVVWEDSRNGSDDIYFNYSTDNGANWQSSDIRLDTGDAAGASGSDRPQISCSGKNVYAVWQEYRNGNPDIYFNYSKDSGASWLPSLFRLDTGDTPGNSGSREPRILNTGNQVYAVWRDDRNGADDIYFNKAVPVTDIKANGSDGPISITQSDTLQITVTLNGFGLSYNTDYWLAYQGPSGWYYFDYSTKQWLPGKDVTHQGPLQDFNNKKVFQQSGLAPGTYTFYFGVDLTMDGKLTKSSLYKDEVQVTVTSN